MKHLIAGCLVALAASTTWAQASLAVDEPWVRATVAQQKTTGAFMRLTAPTDSRVLRARSPIAGVVEIHEMSMQGDVMRMRAVDALPLPAGRAVELKPGGYHVMLMDLKAPVKAGDVVPLILTIEGRDGRVSDIEVKATARGLDGAAPAAGHGAHHKH